MSTFKEVRAWHQASRAVLAQRDDLQPPTCMQDTEKTLEIYNEALYPTMRRLGLRDVVEDNASPHNNNDIRQSHRDNNVHFIRRQIIQCRPPCQPSANELSSEGFPSERPLVALAAR